MPRKARMYVSGVPVHVVQRGHNRTAIFFQQEDYRVYLQILAVGLKRYGADLHAYCLMTNHVHLLMTPSHEDSISRVMQHVGRQYVQYVNKIYQRSGTLWEGRHKGCLIEEESYLLACYRYIELNPVRAGMVSSPEQYLWSSYHSNALANENPLLVKHSLYKAIHQEESERYRLYRALFDSQLDSALINQIRAGVRANYLLGTDHFKKSVADKIGRSVGSGVRGRPVLK